MDQTASKPASLSAPLPANLAPPPQYGDLTSENFIDVSRESDEASAPLLSSLPAAIDQSCLYPQDCPQISVSMAKIQAGSSGNVKSFDKILDHSVPELWNYFLYYS